MNVHIESLQGVRVAIFAAACAERLFPMCERFAQETGWAGLSRLAAALDTVWKVAEDLSLSGELAALGVEALVPHADDYDSCYITAAQNCCICVDLAVASLMDANLRNAAVASEYRVDAMVSVELCHRQGILSADDDERWEPVEDDIRNGAVVRAELAHQARDASLLGGDDLTATLINSVRQESRHRSDT